MAARERAELLGGFAPGGVWDRHPPDPELADALARAAGAEWRCAATGEELIGLLRGMAALLRLGRLGGHGGGALPYPPLSPRGAPRLSPG